MKQFPEVSEEDVTEFSNDLSTDFGITAESLADSFLGKYNSEKKAAQTIYEEIYNEIPVVLAPHIDWQGVWDYIYSHDYNTYEYNNILYVFSA